MLQWQFEHAPDVFGSASQLRLVDHCVSDSFHKVAIAAQCVGSEREENLTNREQTEGFEGENIRNVTISEEQTLGIKI